MSGRRKIEERIQKKMAEIQELEVQIREAKSYLQALQDIAKMFPKAESAEQESESPAPRPGSAVSEAREVIIRAGKPLHISDIFKAIGKEMTRPSRAALAGSLSAYVRRGEIFTRPRPNTFGLTEFESATPEPAAKRTSAPPSNFGIGAKKPDENDDIPF